MTPGAVRDRLIAILPGFGPYWDDPEETCYRGDDGSFTTCGVLMDCSHYLRVNYETLTREQRRALAAFADECMTPPGTDLDNAMATCFLENLTGERFSADLQAYLSGEALDYFRAFGGT